MKVSEVVVGRTWFYIPGGEEGMRYLPVLTVCIQFEGSVEVDADITFKEVSGEYKLSHILSMQDEWRKLFPREGVESRTFSPPVAKAVGSPTWRS